MTDTRQESLADLLGGRGGALDASLPPVAFALGWVLAGQSVEIGAVAAVVCGLAIGVFRVVRGERPRAVVVSVALVVAAALIALRTGHAEDFYLIRVATNAASALAWAASIVVRWPLLGVVVGAVIGQRTRWRQDKELLRAYSVASWAWVGQYVLRVLVLGPLWMSGEVGALGVTSAILTWPLQAVCLAVSWWLLRRALPSDHPGLRHPRIPTPKNHDQR